MTTPREPTLSNLLAGAIESHLIDFHVMLPVKVEKYNTSDGTVDVVVLLKKQKRVRGELLISTFEPIQDVPIAWQRCGKGWLTFPIAKGDTGMIIISDNNLSNWAAASKGEVVDPKDTNRNNFSGAVFVPGLTPTSSPISSPDTDNVVLHTETKLMLGEKGLSDNNLVALAKLVKDEISAVRGSLNDLVTAYNSHTHPYVDTPSGAAVTSPTTSTGTPPNPVGDVKATKVYAK